MLLRSTKKFFQKTIKNFKSFFSSGYYEMLPKTSPYNDHFSYSVAATSVKNMDNKNNTSYQELEKFYNDQWDSEKENEAKRRNKNKAALMLSSPTNQNNEVYNNGRFISFSNAQKKKKNQVEKREECQNQKKKGNLFMMEEKLRELEMLDISNMDHVLDIEEILHYYSRLTCPAYIEIVDKFFMQMYSEFFGLAWYATPCSVNSRMKL
ncbi:hypothetical protein Lal_00003186 [Lupinus albus]|uniref:Uncharacterized protein n=1 Tax=Lupinus albus TaxID=3870 RepID=A0A6A5N6S6_LUPAL|nr:hypothetical protein Lalb_Chr22g0352801 [Lupinus albus]KAF1883004.1 hypothetical protein Lal_00003186 [Lupinus albus]